MTEREHLRAAFDSVPDLYHRVRPRYPNGLIDAVARLSGLSGRSDLLEIGPATGVATEQMAQRGYRITAVELGSDLAAIAEQNLAGYPLVSVVRASFDTWEPQVWGSFDLVFAATAWHWLDPQTKYERAHRHLRDGGSLAFWSAAHVIPDDGDTFFADIQPIYEEIGEGRPDPWVALRPGELPDLTGEVEESGAFEMIGVEHFDWEVSYNADTYLGLLDTFSGHIVMDQWKRDRLYGEIRRQLEEREDGLIRRHWGAALHVAKRR